MHTVVFGLDPKLPLSGFFLFVFLFIHAMLLCLWRKKGFIKPTMSFFFLSYLWQVLFLEISSAPPHEFSVGSLFWFQGQLAMCFILLLWKIAECLHFLLLLYVLFLILKWIHFLVQAIYYKFKGLFSVRLFKNFKLMWHFAHWQIQ